MVHSHTEPHFFPAWIKVLGFDWIWEDERFKGAPHQFPRRRRQGRARPAHLGSDEGEDLRRMDGGVSRERQRVRRRHPEHPGGTAPSPDRRDGQRAPGSTILASGSAPPGRAAGEDPRRTGIRPGCGARLPGQDPAAIPCPAQPVRRTSPHRVTSARGRSGVRWTASPSSSARTTTPLRSPPPSWRTSGHGSSRSSACRATRTGFSVVIPTGCPTAALIRC